MVGEDTHSFIEVGVCYNTGWHSSHTVWTLLGIPFQMNPTRLKTLDHGWQMAWSASTVWSQSGCESNLWFKVCFENHQRSIWVSFDCHKQKPDLVFKLSLQLLRAVCLFRNRTTRTCSSSLFFRQVAVWVVWEVLGDRISRDYICMWESLVDSRTGIPFVAMDSSFARRL